MAKLNSTDAFNLLLDAPRGGWRSQVAPKGSSTKPRPETVARQKPIATACRQGGEETAALLLGEWDIGGAEQGLTDATALPSLGERLTVKHFTVPSPRQEEKLFDLWKGVITASAAARPSFWTAAILVWQARGEIDPDWTKYLAESRHKRDGIVRSLCYHLGGLPHVRGKTSVLTQCPMATAWWRTQISRQVAGVSEGMLTAEGLHDTLGDSVVWRVVADNLVRRWTALAEPRALAAVFASFDDQHPKQDELRNRMSRLAGWKDVVDFAYGDLRAMMDLVRGI